MGRRRSRKQERKSGQKATGIVWEPEHARNRPGQGLGSSFLVDFETPVEPPKPTRLCGNCLEFVEDADAGRGTCLHPGSGILSPWTDTAGCDFFARRRGER